MMDKAGNVAQSAKESCQEVWILLLILTKFYRTSLCILIIASKDFEEVDFYLKFQNSKSHVNGES